MLPKSWILSVCALAVFVAAIVAGCAAEPPSGLTGDPAAGQVKFSQSCSGCHTASSLQGSENRIITNLGLLDGAMAGVTLTDQEVADLQAYISSL